MRIQLLGIFMLISVSMFSQSVESVVSELKTDFSNKGWTYVYESSANTTDEIFVSSKMRTYTPGYDYAIVAVAGDCKGCEMRFMAMNQDGDESYSEATVEMKGQVIIGSMIIEFDKNTTVEILAHVDSRYSYYTKLLLYQKKK